VEYIKIEYVEDIPSDVLNAYKRGLRNFRDKDYGYEFNQRNGIIERVLVEEVDAFGYTSAFHHPRELVDHSMDPSIQKLTEFCEKGDEK